MANHSGPSLAEISVAEQREYGRWRVEKRVDGSRRHVYARCLDCDRIYTVDIYELTRPSRRPTRCRSCNNKQMGRNYRATPGAALTTEVIRGYRKNAKKRGIDWDLDIDVATRIIAEPCWYCGTMPNRLIESSWDSIIVNGIDRRDNTVGYIESNVVPACKDCNYAKRALSEQAFIKLCQNVARRHEW